MLLKQNNIDPKTVENILKSNDIENISIDKQNNNQQMKPQRKTQEQSLNSLKRLIKPIHLSTR